MVSFNHLSRYDQVSPLVTRFLVTDSRIRAFYAGDLVLCVACGEINESLCAECVPAHPRCALWDHLRRGIVKYADRTRLPTPGLLPRDSRVYRLAENDGPTPHFNPQGQGRSCRGDLPEETHHDFIQCLEFCERRRREHMMILAHRPHTFRVVGCALGIRVA